MIINLKQTEIEQALRAYVNAQGISLVGKELSITFTAGRRESGITAEVSIEDVDIPGFTDTVIEETAPKATVVSLAQVAAPAVVAEVQEVQAQVEEVVESAAETVTEAPAAKAASLFG